MATGSHLAVNLQELEMLKREIPHQMPAGVQRSTSLDSMPPPAQPAPVANNTANNDRLQQQQQQQQSMVGMADMHNSLSSPPQACPVQRSRSLPLLDANQDIPPEILAQLTERDNDQIMVASVGQHSMQQQQQEPQEQPPPQQQQQQQHNNISNSISSVNSISISNVVSNTSSINNFPYTEYASSTQHRLLTQPQLQQATPLSDSAQPLNLSQTAEVRQILSQSFGPQHIQRATNFAGRQVPVPRDYLTQGFDWTNIPQARYAIRPTEPRLGFPSMLSHGIGQMPPGFNTANFGGRAIDTYGVGATAEGVRYSMPGAMNSNLQKHHVPLSMLAQRHAFIKEEGGRQSPKDISRVLNVPMDQADNNNDKSSPNIQALSNSTGSSIAEKNMMPLSVSVSVAFSEPSQDSPSFSQQSNSPALCKPAADQTLSMINYHEDHLLSDSGLMSNSPVPSTLDESFLNSTMIINSTSGARLGDAANLTGLDSNPPSVKMEGFDLFEGSGDVDEQNYITDSISPQSLSMDAADSNHGLPNAIQAGQGNPRPLAHAGVSPAHQRGLDAGAPQQQGDNGPVGMAAAQPRPRKGRPKVGGGQGHRYQQPCPTCGKVFGSSSALAKHKLIHSNERRHKCLLCAKSFKRQDHLTGHMLTHRSKKPYECAVDNCGKSYCDIRSLRRHFESQHPGLVMEDNMNYTGDEKDPDLMAAEAAAVQASRQNQALMRGSPGADFALGLGNPQDLNQSGSSQDTSTDSQGSSSSAALQSLALAAQRVQSNQDQSPVQGQLPINSQDMPPIYRLDTYASQMFGGNLPSSVAQSILSGSGGSMTTALPGGPRELSIQVPNPRVQGLSLSSGMGLSGNGMLPNQSGSAARYHNQGVSELSMSSKSLGSSNKVTRPHEKERITVECSVCKRTFKSMPALNGHMRLHGGYNNTRGDVVSAPKPAEKHTPPPAVSNSQPRTAVQPNANNNMNAHPQLVHVPGSQVMGQHRLPVRMVGPSSTPPSTMHLSSVYTNTTTSHVPSWTDYRHPRPQTVTSGKPAHFLPNLSVAMLHEDELTTLAHAAVGLAQSQAMQKPPVQIPQPPSQPPQHVPMHHTTPLPMDRIQPVLPFPARAPIASKPVLNHTNQPSFFPPKEELLANSPSLMRSPSPPKLEAENISHSPEKLGQTRQPEIQPAKSMSLPKIEDESRSKDNVFRDPPPVQPSPTKKKSRPPSLFIPSWASTVTPGGITPSTYQSQMRSPREIGVLYRTNSNSNTPPPYTPPPMLSPIRSGSGLYFSVGSSSMPAAPAVTPKSAFAPSTPSMLQMHRRGSISASTDDSDFAFPSEPHINVGTEYQAAIPDIVKNKEEVLEQPDKREGKIVWNPSTNSKYSESELTSFLKLATTPSLPAGARNIEYAHHCLHRAKGDIEMALLMLLNRVPVVQDEDRHMMDYRYDFSQEWTNGERKLFRDMYKAKGKDFHEIAKGIPTKTVKDCVEYYYWWKKLYPYNHDMQKYCHHSGANPNEDMRRNECEDKPAPQQGQFVCNYPHCEASFKSRQALNGHIRVHGGSYKPANTTSTTTTASAASNQSRSTTTSSSSTTSSSYRGGGGMGQNAKRMPQDSSDEMNDDDEEEDEEDSEEGSSREMSENDQDDDDLSSEDDSSPRFPCKICHKVFDKVKSRNAHMKSHRASDERRRHGGYGGKEEQMFNHYMRQESQSGTSSEEEEDDDEEEEEEEGMEDDDDGIDEEDEDMMSSEEDMSN
ncbi:uncharacterized protein [Diadema setosum]|uniref:uncharacterized protein isoform X2 n=1 Tax=Diadema setosum TaxID=31175 RepID=UPI003B3BE8D7